jgi:hypothetical protein
LQMSVKANNQISFEDIVHLETSMNLQDQGFDSYSFRTSIAFVLQHNFVWFLGLYQSKNNTITKSKWVSRYARRQYRVLTRDHIGNKWLSQPFSYCSNQRAQCVTSLVRASCWFRFLRASGVSLSVQSQSKVR